jgi:glutamine cyclotransferase
MKKIYGLLAVLACISACNNAKPDVETSNDPPQINYSVVHIYPHDTTAYTEGLLFHEGQLYESTGHTDELASSRSLFGVLSLQTGLIRPKVEIDPKKYFGEGIVFLKGKVYQLTYTTKVGFIYDAKTFKKLGEFTIPSEQGWGMTTDGIYLIMSDGTSNIRYLDPETFKLVKVVGVSDNNGAVGSINELEMINGFIYANQWLTNYILKIDPASGKVIGRMDLSSLDKEAKNKYPEARELNGIAYDSATRTTFVSGKDWPNIYEIRFNP